MQPNVLFISAIALAWAVAAHHSAPPDACKLVTVAEVQGVLGVAVAPPQGVDDDFIRSCSYMGTGGHNLFLETREMQKADFERGMSIVKHGLPVGSGIGADAYTERGGSNNLIVWKKGTALTIHLEDQTGNTTPEKKEQGQEQIAKIALSRL